MSRRKGLPRASGTFIARGTTLQVALLPMYLFTLAFVVGPLLYMVALSFMHREGAWGVAAEFTLRNYRRIGIPEYAGTFSQSIQLALFSTAMVVLIGYPFGYFMARLRPVWRNRVMLLVIIPFWTSSLMRLYGWIIVFRANGTLDRILMALGIIQEPLKLLYTYPAVVTGMIYALVPFMIYSVYASAEKLDWELVEAARDLGASAARAFFTVSLPLTMPGLFSGVVLTFIPSMGLFFIADILGGNKVVLVGNLIHEQLMRAHDWPFAAALSVVLMVMTTVFISLYRRLARSLGGSGDLEGLV
ncbi:spermidine/putrescine transport system permease protein PotB [Treponema primitia ZAS-2]|uniref:Spermidine/putrescine transport system permease protein PotB n=1 Tax=Treponema primitia (strain ATCC BAA-887 / DSM 12427 / ZAS-2) TaxID=545694 RepID=F5YQ33_TREPZ|nr:ABC transporter permease [Treponema primitia]AEF85736.1 spermidine/putrescine transport system permease protein PotB [Treponema primitia ZAS-2]